MDPRVSTVESDIAAVRATVEAIRINYATNVGLAETEGRLRLEIAKLDKKIDMVAADQTHQIALVAAEFSHKADQAAADYTHKVDQVAADLKVEFHKAVGDMRVSILTTAIALFTIYGAMFIGIVKYLLP